MPTFWSRPARCQGVAPARSGRDDGRWRSRLAVAATVLVTCVWRADGIPYLIRANVVFDDIPPYDSKAGNPVTTVYSATNDLQAGKEYRSGYQLRDMFWWDDAPLSKYWPVPWLPPGEPRARFVKGTATRDVFGECKGEWVIGPDVVGDAQFSDPLGFVLTRLPDDPSAKALALSGPGALVFRKGGTYRSCWSPGGDFDNNNRTQLLFGRIRAFGLDDTCDYDDCLRQKSLSTHSTNPPIARYSSPKLFYIRVEGESRNITFAPAATASYDADGAETAYDLPNCSELTGDVQDSFQTETLIDPVTGLLGESVDVDFTAGLTPEAGTYTVCYCPSKDLGDYWNPVCESGEDYTQAVGVVMMYKAVVCNPLEGASCTTHFHEVAAGQRFASRIFCPPGGCPKSGESRFKLALKDDANLIPSWDVQSGCMHAEHNVGWVPRGNCKTIYDCAFGGGPRQDHKTFGDSTAWLAWDPEMRPGAERKDMRRTQQDVDVCFCAANCEGGKGVWFKAGEIRVSPLQVANPPAQSNLLTTVGVPGKLYLDRPAGDAPALGMATGGVVKLIGDDAMAATWETCNAASIGDLPVDGLRTVAETLDRVSVIGPDGGLVFDGGDNARLLAVQFTGIIAICYCQQLDSAGKCETGGFFIAGRLAISGPLFDQRWTISTLSVFSLEYRGVGLQETDVLRISDSPCAGDSVPAGNPSNNAGTLMFHCRTQCAVPGAGDNLATELLSTATFGCDEAGQGCRQVDRDVTVGVRIKEVVAMSTGVELIFYDDPRLETGDQIIIGTDVDFDGGILGGTPEQLDALSGTYTMADGHGNLVGTRQVIAHPVSESIDGLPYARHLRGLQYGSGGEPMPTFAINQVQEVGRNKRAGGARWTRTNKARTKYELLMADGAAPSSGALHVCWRGGNTLAAGTVPGAGYTAEVGQITFYKPPEMPTVNLVFLAPVVDVMVPAVLAFTTGNSAYPVRALESGFVVRFTKPAVVTPFMTDGSAVAGISKSQASQALCASILLEAWSERADDGFPLPRHCRYRPFYRASNGNEVWELEMEFENFNGLAPNTRYQLVLNAKVSDASQLSDAIVLEASEDLRQKPLEAVEHGYGSVVAVGGASFGVGLDGGNAPLSSIDVVGNKQVGVTQLLELQDGFHAKLSIEALRGTAGMKLRLVLWPITQWQVTGDVLAQEVAVDATWPPGSRRMLASMTASAAALDPLLGDHTSTIVLEQTELGAGNIATIGVSAAGGCQGGVFGSRLSAVVSAADDWGSAQYLATSMGALLHAPMKPAAMIVRARGDGNPGPYVNQQNEVYIRLLATAGLPLTSTLTIQSPPYASCGEATPLIEGAILNVTSPPPYGAGAFRNGVWTKTTEEAKCIWTLSNSVILPGSSIFMKVDFQNPPDIYNTADETNRWYAALEDTSYDILLNETFKVTGSLNNNSATGGGNAPFPYGVNVAVVGVLPFVTILPDSMLKGTRHTVWIFFQVANIVYPSGVVQVEAPRGFDFGGGACEAKELPFDYYRGGGGGDQAVLDRLPRLQSCSTSKWLGSEAEYTRARIAIGKELLPGVMYGFGLAVTNPNRFDPQEQKLWVVTTLDSTGSAIDQSDGYISMDGALGRGFLYSWGLYDAEIGPNMKVRWGDVMPYELMYMTSFLTFEPFVLDVDMNTPIKLTAPIGYEWMQPSYETGWLAELPGRFFPPFPAVPVARDKIFLFWDDPVPIKAGQEYYFRIPMKAPRWPSTQNLFWLEFGDRITQLDEGKRPLTKMIPGPENIRVLRGATVDYLTGRTSTYHEVTIRVTTISAIFPGEGFAVLGGGVNTKIKCECPTSESLAEYKVDCNLVKREEDGQIFATFRASETLFPKRFEFRLRCLNPKYEFGDNTWQVVTCQDPTKFPRVVPLDGMAEMSGWQVRLPMGPLELIPSTNDAAAGRDARPYRPSSTILKFFLQDADAETEFPLSTTSFARLRAPEYSLWEIDCLDDIISDSNLIMSVAGGVPLPNECEPMPKPHLCRGIGWIAELTWEIRLPRDKYYCFRAKLRNPPYAPIENVWTLEVDEQASTAIQAHWIQAFANIDLQFASRSLLVPGSVMGGPNSNRARLTFMPTVAAKVFTLTVPGGFDFGASNSCGDTRMVGRLPQPGGESLFFVPRLTSCKFLGKDLTMVFQENTTVGATFELDVDVLSPATPVPVTPEPIPANADSWFMLSSMMADGVTFGDEKAAEPPLLFEAGRMSLRNIIGGVESAAPARFEIKFTFVSPINETDRIRITLPEGFDFSEPCSATWITPSDGPPPYCWCRKFNRCYMTFYARGVYVPGPTTTTAAFDVPGLNVTEESSDEVLNTTSTTTSTSTSTTSTTTTVLYLSDWPLGQEMHLEIDVINPLRILNIYENFWEVVLMGPDNVDPFGDNDIPREVVAHRGFEVRRPLGGVEVLFANTETRRAGVFGATLRLTFYAENEAVVIELTGHTPAGWDFTRAELCGLAGTAEANKCMPAQTDPATPTILKVPVEIKAGDYIDREIRNVGTPSRQGLATFEMSSFSYDLTGNYALADASGKFETFITPGALTDQEQILRTEQFMVTTPGDTLIGQLPPRVGVPETIIFWSFTTTEDALPGDYFMIRSPYLELALSPRYVMLAKRTITLGLEDITTKEIIAEQDPPASVYEPVGQELRVRLLEGLPRADTYIMYLSAEMLRPLPTPPPKFIIVELMRKGFELPIATNDGYAAPGILNDKKWLSGNSIIPFTLISEGPSPLAMTDISGQIPAGFPSSGTAPLTLVAPVGLVFLEPCVPTPCEMVVMNFGGTGRSAVWGIAPDDNGNFAFRVQLPRFFIPGQNSWVLLVPGPDATAERSPYWAYAEGFPLRDMPASVSYSAVSLAKNIDFAVSFTPGAAAARLASCSANCPDKPATEMGKAVKTAYAAVRAPVGYKLFCDETRKDSIGFYDPITLPTPTQATCIGGDTVNELIVTIYNGDLEGKGALVFKFLIDVPIETPEVNFFDVVLRDLQNNTIDANVAINGRPVTANRLYGTFVWVIGSVESVEWLRVWVVESRKLGVFQTTIADFLGIPKENVFIHDVQVELLLERRLDSDTSFPAVLSNETPIHVPADAQQIVVIDPNGFMAGGDVVLSRRLQDVCQLLVKYSVILRLDPEDPSSRENVEAKLQSSDAPYLISTRLELVARKATLTTFPLGNATVDPGTVLSPPNVTGGFLGWTHARPGAISLMRFGFTLLFETEMIKSLVVVLPEGFNHRIQAVVENDIIVSSNFPRDTSKGPWMNTWSTGIVRVLLDSEGILKPGDYEISFFASVPAEMPDINVWNLCLCAAPDCDGTSHASLLISFAFEGFKRNERMKAPLLVGHSWRGTQPGRAVLALALALMFVVCKL
eukprot:TRINITY_DN25772_c0_g1_i1.p1 TRINITY_DN25772_c0_g1~~TRINITY_DN25772_c0_g1_i1.p1  ORF type:complete len:3363 (+),score=580.56 TRINITY_DN25772_c0_g1_i1:119-10207(+)